MKKSLLILLPLAGFLISLAVTKPTQAHGGGPPFLFMNEKVANTNPLYLASTKVFTAQDLAPDKYVVGSPIQFRIDLQALAAGIAGVNADQLEFRWSFEENSKDYSFEKNPTHTYTKAGTHYLTFEARPPDSPDWAVLDTVKIDVVPSADYSLPTVQIATVGKSYQVDKPITFVSQAKTDSNKSIASYFWDLGDSTGKQERVSKTFSDTEGGALPYPIFLRATDNNGIVAEDLVYTRVIDKSVLLNGSIHQDIPIVKAEEKALNKAPSSNLVVILAAVSLIAIVVIIGFLRRNKVGKQ